MDEATGTGLERIEATGNRLLEDVCDVEEKDLVGEEGLEGICAEDLVGTWEGIGRKVLGWTGVDVVKVGGKAVGSKTTLHSSCVAGRERRRTMQVEARRM